MWFRRDLRLDDNPAWASATASSFLVVPVYVLDTRLLERAGAPRRRYLLAALRALDAELADRVGGRLLVRTGDPTRVVPELAAAHGASTVHWNDDVTPFAAARDDAVRASLGAVSVGVVTTAGCVVHAPGRVLTAKRTLSRVFTPFYRSWLSTPWDPWPEPGSAVVTAELGESVPSPDAPPPVPVGSEAALGRLEAFLERVDRYDDERDRPDLDSTSHLGADLRFGTLSVRTAALAVGESTPGRAAFVRQLAWRDWYAHLLAASPDLPRRALRSRYDAIAWRDDPGAFEAWSVGRTGVPFVDAGMRQLHATGWMHNRVRMVAASFLVKNLLIDWRVGERHFRHHLVDGDVAQNVGNWQWVAGTGPDSSPYNRVFNPVLQGRRFDPAGAYVRRWVPELASLPTQVIHAPWEAAPLDLAAAGVVLGHDYPAPVVDLAESRLRALAAYASVNDRGVRSDG